MHDDFMAANHGTKELYVNASKLSLRDQILNIFYKETSDIAQMMIDIIIISEILIG